MVRTSMSLHPVPLLGISEPSVKNGEVILPLRVPAGLVAISAKPEMWREAIGRLNFALADRALRPRRNLAESAKANEPLLKPGGGI